MNTKISNAILSIAMSLLAGSAASAQTSSEAIRRAYDSYGSMEGLGPSTGYRSPTGCDLGLCGYNVTRWGREFSRSVQPAKAKHDKDHPLKEVQWGKHYHSDRFSRHTSRAIDKYGARLVSSRPADIVSFCPSYDYLDKTQKKAFWMQFVSALALEESGLDRRKTERESFNYANGRDVVSRGLLQLSRKKTRGYDCASVRRDNDLYDPAKNLDCGVQILSDLVGKHGMIAGKKSKWRGGATYWHKLRDTASMNRIRGKTMALCENRMTARYAPTPGPYTLVSSGRSIPSWSVSSPKPSSFPLSGSATTTSSGSSKPSSAISEGYQGAGI